MENSKTNKNSLIYTLLLITVFFSVWFPKAGIKLSGIPLTIGNIAFLLTLFLWFLNKVSTKKLKMYNIGNIIFVLILYVLLKYGIAYYNGKNVMSYITYIIPLIVYPFIYFITKELLTDETRKDKLLKIITYGFLFICIYGILQFIVGIGNCDIPGLTVNYTDYIQYGDSWFLTKNNGIDLNTSKIFSTYQNGNLFGINLLIIFPLVYFNLKKKKKNKMALISIILFIICSFLTLSRACWVGMVLFIFGGLIFDKTFKNGKKTLLKKTGVILCFIIALFSVLYFLPDVANRFFNTQIDDWINMSGRTFGLINVIDSVNQSNKILPWLFGPEGLIKYTGTAYEMLPIALFAQIGIIGLIIVYILFFKIIKEIDSEEPLNKSIKIATIIWMIVGLIECGFWLPPTALNLFMILGLAKMKNERIV